MICPNCQNENLDSATFCRDCGERLPDHQSASVSAAPEPEPSGPLQANVAEDVAQIAPKDWVGMIREAFDVYRARFWTFFFLALLPELVIGAVFAALVALVVVILAAAGISIFNFGNEFPDFAKIAPFILLFVILLMVAITGVILVSIVSTAGMVNSVGRHYLESPVSFAVAVRSGFKKLWTIILVGLLLFLILIVPLLLSFVLIGIPFLLYISVRLGFAVQAVVLEDMGPVEAISRSWRLVEGYWWRTFLIGVAFGIVSLIVYIVGSLIALILDRIGIPFLGSILSFALGTLIAPFGTIACTVLYLDLRVRHRGESVRIIA